MKILEEEGVFLLGVDGTDGEEKLCIFPSGGYVLKIHWQNNNLVEREGIKC